MDSSDADQGDGREPTVVGHRLHRLPRTVAVAVVLGAFGGLVTVVFIRILESIQHVLWTTVPDALGVAQNVWYYVIPVVAVGAVLLGLGRKHLGEYPVSIEEAIEDHKRTGEFDHHHLWQAIVLSLISLGFGAALGPEAALTALIGGISSWVARVIDANTTEGSDLSFIGVSGAMGALFGTAGAAAITLDPHSDAEADARSGRLVRLLPGLAAAGAGLLIYEHLGSSDRYFDLGLPEYTFAASDLAWAIPVAVVSAAAGLLFLALGHGFDRLLAPLAGRPVLESLVGGIPLAVLATFSSLILFSGHEGVDTLIADYGDDSVRFLVLIALGKLAIAALLLTTKWKGGRFFPMMFVGAALGLAMNQLMTGVGEVPAVAAGMTAVVGVLIKRPLAAGLLMMLFFPPTAWPIVIGAAIIGAVAGKRLAADA